MKNDRPATLLDVTRLVSRIGRGPLTGIDRIELEYLRKGQGAGSGMLLWVGTEHRGHPGGILLGPDVIPLLERLATAGAQGKPGWWQTSPRQSALWSIWQRCRAQARRGQMERLLADSFPGGGLYLNVGHANLSAQNLATMEAVGMTVSVMIHDTIPLDHPEFCRVEPGGAVSARFAEKLSAVAQQADRITCPSAAVAADLARHLGEKAPPLLVAPPGVTPAKPDKTAAAALWPMNRPWFTAIGTIEPRKNHAFLLDLWEELARDASADTLPGLVIIGQRGWAAPEILARIAALPPDGPVRVFHDLSDPVAMAFLAGARGLLFPSLAEGCGLPALEAAALGIPVVCNDLPVFRELLGNYPVYADSSDRYSWIEAIEQLAWAPATDEARKNPPPLPSWEQHFDRVLTRVVAG